MCVVARVDPSLTLTPTQQRAIQGVEDPFPMRDLQSRATPSNHWPRTHNEQVNDLRDLEWMYCNQNGRVRYATDTVDVRQRQKCCKTAKLPDTPVGNEMGMGKDSPVIGAPITSTAR